MAIQLRNIRKAFRANDTDEGVAVLDNIDLEVPSGAIAAIFGPNGCGKTTLLNIAAGIETADFGEVTLERHSPERLNIGYVFQNYRDTLLPWATALDNVAFGLRAQGRPVDRARQEAAAFLDKQAANLPRANYAYQLSLGQQQTAALLRTLMQKPANLLLDEPFSALDHKARFRMQETVTMAIRASGAAALFVSHDIDECLYLSQELILLSRRPARVLQRFRVPFPYPRQPELLASAEFAALRREVVAAFVREVES